jgi:hypothetical protein
MPTRKGENQTIREAEGPAGGAAGNVEILQPGAGAIPPGALPQVNLESGTSADAEPFLAPAPRSNGTIRGYGHARVGRVPPHGGSPSSGPLTGLPLQTRRPPPAPPVLRRQALEPGHREPDPFLKIPAFDPDLRLPAEVLLEGIEGIARSAAALRSVPEPRRGGAGRHGPLVGAASPAGSGGARVAASVGVPLAESVRTSDRGLYVAGRASGARWDSNGKVAPRPPATDRCAARGSAAGGRPLTHLQSVLRYARHQQARGEKIEDTSETPASGIPPPVQAQSSGASAVTRAASKGVSPAFKGLSKAQAPARSFAGMEGRQGDEGDAKPDPDRERRLLAGRAMLQGLGGRFGARSRCQVDPSQALRPAPGLAELRREGASAQELARTHADAQPNPRGKRSAGAASAKPSDAGRTRRGPAAVQPQAGECPVASQKYAAEAGVRMRDTGAATAAMPPDGAASAAVDGVPTERQTPWGQAGPTDAGGSRRHALAERSPGDAGGAAHGPARAPAFNVDARGMGAASAPVLLDVDQRLRAEAEAKVRARESAETLTREIDAYLETAGDSMAERMLSASNAFLKTTLDAAFRDTGRLDGAMPASGWFQEADRLVLRVKASQEALKATGDLAAARLATMAMAADHAEAAAANLRRETEGLNAASRVLGNMDRDTLSRRAGEAARRAEREVFRAQRRALRREKNGAFRVRQLVKAEAAYERSTALDARADRYRREAEAKRPGAERDRANAKADYYGSLADHERNRALLAQTHAVSEAAGRLKGGGRMVAERLREAERIRRNNRKSIELGRSLAVQESQLRAVRNEIAGLVERDGAGRPTVENGEYVLRHKSDSWRMRSLLRKEDRLEKELQGSRRQIAAVGRSPLESVQAEIAQIATTDESGRNIPWKKSDLLRLRILERKARRLSAEQESRREKVSASRRTPLESVQAELGRLATTDGSGNYVPLRKSDSLRVRVLARKQRRLAAEQRERQRRAEAGPGSRKDDADTLVARRDALLLKIALSSNPPQGALSSSMLASALSLLPEGAKSWLRRKVDPSAMSPRKLQAALRAAQALVNIKMSEQIKDASGQAEAALAAGRRAAIARYDQTLPESDRAEAARVHEAALARATLAVEKIANAIKNKTYKSKKEQRRDEEKLARAREIVRLLDPCSSDACADARDKCKDNPPEYCEFKLRRQPDPFGDPVPRGEPGGAQDLGMPSGSEDAAVTPGGSEESDGEDAEGAKKDRDNQPIEPSEHAGDAGKGAEQEDQDRKRPSPDGDGGGQPALFGRIGGFVESFAAAVKREAAMAIQDAGDLLAAVATEVEQRVEEARRAREWDVAIADLAVLGVKAVQNVEGSIAKAATREEVLAEMWRAQREVTSARNRVRAEADDLWEVVADSTDPHLNEVYRQLKANERHLGAVLDDLGRKEEQLVQLDQFEETDARRSIGNVLRGEADALRRLDLGEFRRSLDGENPRTARDKLERLKQRLEFAIRVSGRASVALDGVGYEEDDRNGRLGSARRSIAKWYHGDGYVDWAGTLSGSVAVTAAPDFAEDSTDFIEGRLRSYDAETADLARAVGERADEYTHRLRLANVFFTTARISAALAGVSSSVSVIGWIGTAKVAGASFVGGAGYSGARQTLQHLQHGRAFSVSELLETGLIAAEFGVTIPGLASGALGRAGGGRAGFGLPLSTPKGDFTRSAQVTEELLAVARSPKFVERARKLGFSDETIKVLSARIRNVRVGERPRGGWADREQILIGRRGLITPTRKGRIFHELGHVLDDLRNPGLFERSAQRSFGVRGFYEAEKVAYGMQYGPGSIRGAVLAPYGAIYGAYPTATTVGAVMFSATTVSALGYVIYERVRE